MGALKGDNAVTLLNKEGRSALLHFSDLSKNLRSPSTKTPSANFPGSSLNNAIAWENACRSTIPHKNLAYSFVWKKLFHENSVIGGQ
ncbi:hypothetical protein KL949_004408 [Ogataea haglerorum]|nr:hypothetical protein KL950_004519 [Ogataea haglerorum]KAG7715015.1 hypothetical protein KL949_004408 [Ogataea haglerorum]KAG7805189.1 hypothetical protein KL924_004906 [Ogataea haglerorum]